MAHQSVRLSVAALGFTVLAVGLVLLVTPGPGLLVIIAGLAILAHEFAWAATALEKARTRAAMPRRSRCAGRPPAGLRRPAPRTSTSTD